MPPSPSDPGSRSPPGGGASPQGEPDSQRPPGIDAPIDERSLSRLKWRCRRGLLENDLILERFFRVYEDTLTVRQAGALEALMDLPDNDLLDLLLERKAPQGRLDTLAVHEVLALLRRQPALPIESPR